MANFHVIYVQNLQQNSSQKLKKKQIWVEIFLLLLQDLAEIIEEELEAEAQDPCNGRTCSMNEQCCNGHVCVDTEDSKYLTIWH